MSARLRTGYSFRSAVGSIDNVIKRLKEIGRKHAVITDTCSTFGYVRWAKAAKGAELHPVYGVELAITDNPADKKRPYDYWTFIAGDSLRPVHDLISQATANAVKFGIKTAFLTVEEALNRGTGFKETKTPRDDVYIIMGHKTDHSKIAPADNLYVGLSPSLGRGPLARAVEAGHWIIACDDNRYPSREDYGLYETVCGFSASKQTYPQWILSDEEWSHAVQIHAQADADLCAVAIENREVILAASVAGLSKAEMVHPERPASLRKMCEVGAKELGINLKDAVYAERLKRELALIHEKKFEDYFYLVSDICQWARGEGNMLVGPARGSSCGSLVCYLLKITTVDPIPYGLIFERFIDINRADLPDIDIDFPELRRQEVFDYVAGKYGADHVARLGTVAMYQPRSALKEVAGAMDIDYGFLNPVLDSIIERSSGDSRALQATEDTLKDTPQGRKLVEFHPEVLIATEMEGHPRHAGQHAAGIVITDHPVIDYVAVDARTGAAMCDKKDAEELNLLKIDALGLTQLSTFEKAMTMMKPQMPFSKLFSIPLNDQAAFDILNDGKFAGIFQFNGLALQALAKSVKIESLMDIVAITALARPGPLASGGTTRWIAAKNGGEVKYPHPLFEPMLRDTLGVVAYQEQVMIIGREIGGLSWEDVTALRKAMSKSLGKEFFDKYGDRWKAGAMEKGVPQAVCDKVWDDLCSYGSWAFNLSHAVAYGIVSYYCAWMKAHYPMEFSAATLTMSGVVEEQLKVLRELAAEGIDYLPVHSTLSERDWTVGTIDGEKKLIGPLTNVIGIGPKLLDQIMEARVIKDPSSCNRETEGLKSRARRAKGEGAKKKPEEAPALPTRAAKLLANPVTQIDTLYPITDAFAKLIPDPSAMNIITKPTSIIDVQPSGRDRTVVVFVVVQRIIPRDENEVIKVEKRGGRRIQGQSQYLNMRLADDTDVILGSISRTDFDRLARPIIDRGRAGTALYVMKGVVPGNFRMIRVQQVKYIGDLKTGAPGEEE